MRIRLFSLLRGLVLILSSPGSLVIGEWVISVWVSVEVCVMIVFIQPVFPLNLDYNVIAILINFCANNRVICLEVFFGYAVQIITCVICALEVGNITSMTPK